MNEPLHRRLASALLLALSAAFVPGPAQAAPPGEPLVLDDIPTPGHRGGDLRSLVSSSRDTRLYYVYGHTRLVNYDRKLQLFADILKSFDVEEGRIFTFKLRTGHKWSDGQPFTTEDFRFWWEDVAQNSKLSPTGPPIELAVDGELPKVEVLSDVEIRFSWSKPNPYFLPSLAAAAPLFIYMPAHYLKQFHEKYADAAALAAKVKADNARDWAQLFGRKERMNKFDNPDLPTLEPWMLTTSPPADRYVAVRNPFYHRVDTNGQQLPYFDRFILQVVDTKLVPIKTGAGETDLQARGLFFKDYTFLKESEKRSGLDTMLWREARGAHLAIFPNLNAADPVWRQVFRERDFRKALSLSINRDALSQYLYFGLAKPANNTILRDSPLFTEAVGNACLGHDVAEANRLLDGLALKRNAKTGLRSLPDGRPLELIVETAGEDTEQTDLLELVRDAWEQVGVRIHTKPSEREVLRNRIFAGDALMTIWYGIENGIPTADMSPQSFAPTSQYDQPQWPKWGQYFETKGKAGEPPDLPAAQRLAELNAAWGTSWSTAEREKIWKEMLEIYSSECFTIGTVAEVMQPIARRRGLNNLPEEGIYTFEPTAQFGIYRPDTFWLQR